MAHRETARTKIVRRLLGLLYLAVVAGLVLLSVEIYDKAFTTVVLVKLKTDHTGNSLSKGSDVKERGIIVGEVRSVHVNSGPNGGCASTTVVCVTVTLALDPGRIGIIPNNVSAQILPKTIFGEQYVSLELPSVAGPHITSHDVISQDRSKGALETEKVLGDLLPILQAVHPDELATTLTAVAQALNGRGAELGTTLTALDHYLKQFNPHTEQFVNDLSQLGNVSDELNQVAPNVIATLKNFNTTSATLIDEKNSLNSLLNIGQSTSITLDAFLRVNKDSLITLTDTSDKVYALLAEYSPEYTCLVDGLAHLSDQAASIVQKHQIRLSAVIDNTNLGAYKPGEQPRLITGLGPHCFGLPNNPQPVVNGKFQIPAQFQCLNDGAALTNANCPKGGTQTQTAMETFEGSQGENALINSLIASTYNTTPNNVPYIATMLSAPLYRGAEVTVK